MTKTKKKTPAGHDRHSALVWAAFVVQFRHLFSAALVEQAMGVIEDAAKTLLSYRRKHKIVARDGKGTLPPDDPAREQIVRAEVGLETLAVLEQRTTMLESDYWGSVAMVRLDNLPLEIAHRVIDHSLRTQLRKVNGRRVPRLQTEQLNEETSMDSDRERDWLHDRELLALLQNARHPTLRKAYAALTSANAPNDWPEMASRVGRTEQWIRW